MARIKRTFVHRTPWSYTAGTTPLHRLPAGIKIILLIVLSASPFFGLPFALGGSVLILFGAITSGLKLRGLFSGALPFAVVLFFFALLRAIGIKENTLFIDTSPWKSDLYFISGILISYTAASLFFSVTTVTEIRKTLAAAEQFLFHRQSRLSLAFALMLGFLPRFFECWENAYSAARARCCKNTLRIVMVILPLVTERMIETAAETALAMESRGMVM